MKRNLKIMLNDIQIRHGVVGGTFLSTIFNISLHDVVFTVVMAVIGAVVCFFCFLCVETVVSE